MEQVTYGTMVSVMPRISSSHQVEMEVNIEDGGEKQSKSGEVSNVEGLPLLIVRLSIRLRVLRKIAVY